MAAMRVDKWLALNEPEPISEQHVSKKRHTEPSMTKMGPELLEKLWKHIRYLIIDEVSMISANFFHQVSERISKANTLGIQNTKTLYR